MSISGSDGSRSRSRERKTSSSKHHRGHRKGRQRSRSYSRSRSRSRSRDRRDRRSRSRSRSRSRDRKDSRRSKEDGRRPPSRTPPPRIAPPRFADGDLIVLDFLAAERDLVARMEEDKVRFMEDSTKHPDYSAKWAEFYNVKCREMGVHGVNTQAINGEWIEVWKEFFYADHLRRVREEKNILMNKHKVLRRDIELFTKRHGDPKKHLDARASSKSSTAPAAAASTKRSHSPSPASSVGKQAKVPEPAKHAKSPTQPTADSSNRAPSREKSQEKKDDDAKDLVIKTLRFLSALEDVLDDLGPQIYTCLGRANSLEVNRGAGSSMALVDDQNVYRLLHSAQEKLDRKMRSGAIPERFQQVTRVSLDNATILLQRSKCKKEDIIEKKQPPSAPSPPSMDVPDPMEITVKAAIAKSVAEQFRRAGRYVSGEELSKIVDAEYTRVREQLPSEVMKEQQQVRPAAIQPSQDNPPAANPFGSLNVDWGALKTAVSSVKAPEPAAQNPGYYTDQPSKKEKEVVSAAAADASGDEESVAATNDASDFDDLTLEDLSALFKNFQQLDEDNRTSLIEYMKRLEKTNPTRVRQLKHHIHSNR